MSSIIFTYLILPFALSWFIIKFLKAFSNNVVAEDVRQICLHTPMAEAFRVIKRLPQGSEIVADCGAREDAVEKAHQSASAARTAGEKASFLVVDRGLAIFEQIDS
ncbi:MAG: hypothetical protein ACYCPQ_05705 [Elusimicrobiota bacterium]